MALYKRNLENKYFWLQNNEFIIGLCLIAVDLYLNTFLHNCMKFGLGQKDFQTPFPLYFFSFLYNYGY